MLQRLRTDKEGAGVLKMSTFNKQRTINGGGGGGGAGNVPSLAQQNLIHQINMDEEEEGTLEDVDLSQLSSEDNSVKSAKASKSAVEFT